MSDRRMMTRRLFQAIGWLCLLAVAVLSVVAPSLRPVTFLPHNLEHMAIFVLTGLALGLGYPGRTVRHMIMLVIFAAAIELVQLYVPGRHATLIDFAVDAVGACAGAALAALLMMLFARPAKRGS